MRTILATGLMAMLAMTACGAEGNCFVATAGSGI